MAIQHTVVFRPVAERGGCLRGVRLRARVTLAAGLGVELMMSVVDDDSDRQWQPPVPSTADKPRRMPTMRDVATDVVIRQLLEQRVDTQAPRAIIAEKGG